MHAGRQDVALLRRVCQTSITNLFDTQLAAGFAGLRAQLGYEALLHELLNVRLQKSASFTRWDARPLSAEQIDYARDDVRHILQATSELQERLRARGRLDWAREECVALASATDERDPDTIFAPPAARELAGPQAARDRPRARRLARGDRPHAGPADPLRPVGRDAHRGRQAPAEPDDPARADPRPQRADAAPSRPRDPRGGRARPLAPADPRRRRAPLAARRARRARDRAGRGARAHARAGGRARLRAHRRARRPAAHRARDARRQPAARRAHAAGLAPPGRRRRAAGATRRHAAR